MHNYRHLWVLWYFWQLDDTFRKTKKFYSVYTDRKNEDKKEKAKMVLFHSKFYLNHHTFNFKATAAIFFSILYLSVFTFYFEWLPCYISFVWTWPSCEEQEASENSKWTFPPGIEPASFRFPARCLKMNTHGNACVRLILVGCVLELTCQTKSKFSFLTNEVVINNCYHNFE